MSETTEILSTMIPVFVTAIVCPSICLMIYYMYKARLSFGTHTKNIKNIDKKQRRRKRN